MPEKDAARVCRENHFRSAGRGFGHLTRRKSMIDLCGTWTGASADGRWRFQATVPGCVHTDLQAAGVLPKDLYRRDNADAAQWIEKQDWVYRRTFTVERLRRGAVLVFDALDTYCSVVLNGTVVATCDDMFIAQRIPVDGVLREGENELRVCFESPVRRVEGRPERAHAFTGERLYTRRIQCTYGWDWCMRFVTCGIVRPCRVEFEDEPFLKDAYVFTRALDSRGAEVVCDLEFGCFEQGFPVHLRVTDETGKEVLSLEKYVREPTRREIWDIPDPHLWWPRGFGAQPLYTLTVTIGERVKSVPFGIRTMRILQRRDEEGSAERALSLYLQKETGSGRAYDFNETTSSFTLVVNDVRVFCKGANWVPTEPFLSEVREQKETLHLERSAAAGVNMLRVWGGGVFGSEHFYRECDRLGILVTQDFLMACGDYPEEEAWFAEAMQKEAAFAARALRNHPCLMWWSGDNENAVRGNDRLPTYRGRASALGAIAPVLTRLDPSRPFLPSSPYGGDQYASKTVGTTHNTQFLGYVFRCLEDPADPLSDYRERAEKLLARFIAEEPAFGAASTPTLRKMMTDEDIYEGEAMWEYHTQSNPQLKKTLFCYLCMAAEKLFGRFRDGEDRLFKTQFLQAETVRLSLEQARRHLWYCSGVIFWMLDDCWPAAAGWSLQDYDALPKAGWYAFRRGAADVLASIEKKNGAFTLVLSNLSTVDKKVSVTPRRFSAAGDMTEDSAFGAVVPAQDAVRFPLPAPEKGGWLTADVGGDARDRAFYKEGTLPLVKAPVEATIGKDTVTLRASGYVHVVRLEGEAIFSDNWFSLLPGERKTVTFTPTGKSDPGVTVAAMTVAT